ncbi:MAG: lysophospholipid acyltransferase family protein [Oceanipulchritudo sp.]
MTSRIIDTAELLGGPFSRIAYKPFQPVVERLFGFAQLRRRYHEAGGDETAAHHLCANALRLLNTQWRLDRADWDRLASIDGPLVIVSNHPFGGVDSLILIELMHRLRPGGWKLLSNHVLQSVGPLAPHLIAVDALGLSHSSASINQAAMRESLKFLREGNILGLFPARRVSHLDRVTNSVIDQPWSSHALKLAARTGASVACLHIPGQNSDAFLRVPLRWPRLRGLLLCREIVNAPQRDLNIALARLLSPEEVVRLKADPGGVARLRAHCFLEADKRRFSSRGKDAGLQGEVEFSSAEPAISSSTAPKIPDSFRLFSRDGFDILLFEGRQSSELMEILGRTREFTFCQSGQGVGREVDITPEDPWYHQLLVWDPQRNIIAGAYRLGHVRKILAEQGTSGFYLDKVFHIDRAFYRQFENGLELSRSFVHPDYQRDNRVLPLLWKGLAHVAGKFGADTFYGSVSISNAYSPASRAILVDFLSHHQADREAIRALVQPRNPFIPQTDYHHLVTEAWSGERVSALEPVIRHIEDDRQGIPPLIRYYCSLGARFIAFHVEKQFKDAVYCLLRVDLASIPAAYQRRFR